MRTSVRLSVRCSGAPLGRSLGSVLTPDNVGFPRGLRFRMTGAAGLVRLEIESESLSTGISTSLALLRDISLFEQVWLLLRVHDG
ncbi:MAG: hypothetical protein OK404_01130 [Thaumarchaeota archaeon]|nr:hypothetical protein [Nitrososphaerota archaeon]